MVNKKKCASCKYCGKLNETELFCAYILINERRRGCPSGWKCDKYEKRMGRRRVKQNNRGWYHYYVD